MTDQNFEQGAHLTMAAIDAGKERLTWMKSVFGQDPRTKKWRITMDFNESGEFLDYWESAMDRAGNEMFGGGISRVPETLRLSGVQIDVLLLGVDHKLDRSSMGWSYDDRVNWSDPVRIFSPATIKSLWRRGLVVGNFNDPRGVGNLGELAGVETIDGTRYAPGFPKLQVWTSDLGKEVLEGLGLLPRDGTLH